MLPFCLKYTIRLFVFALLSLLPLAIFAQPVYAARVITSATLNGASSVAVVPSTSITAQVNANLTGGGGGDDWGSTGYQIESGAITCVDHANITNSGTFSQSFTITAPGSNGTYNVNFVIWRNNTCDLEPSTTFTLTGGIVVAAPTSTPAPTATPGAPTNTPAPTATPAPGVPTATPAPGVPTATPAPGVPTATPTSASSISSTSSVTYPSVSLNTYTPNPTNVVPLTFQGLAATQQETIALVEYTYTNGATWLQAQPVDGNFNGRDEHFTFTTPRLAEGTYTIKVRAKNSAGTLTTDGGYASQAITIATTPPQVTLNTILPNPTRDKTPTLTGTVTGKLANITKVEISMDNGLSWQSVKRTGNTFSFTPGILEDNNYQVRARAVDSAGNIGQSDTQTLIVDTIPPIIGGGMLAIGPQVLTPNKNGRISVVRGTNTTIAISMKGGVTEANILTDTKSFMLSPKVGTNIWVGTLMFDFLENAEQAQLIPLTIHAVDGAHNITQRAFNTLTVENSGFVEDAKTKQKIENADVSVYFFEPISETWAVWEGDSYGEHNPQKTNRNGAYSFMVPAGKYYIDAKAAGYKTTQSKIITISQTSILNYSLSLTPKPKIKFTLPFFGNLVLTIPTFSPPETFSLSKPSLQSELVEVPKAHEPGTPASNFSLPNLEGRLVSVTDYRGRKLLLTFITPWSSLSLEQIPLLSDLASHVSGNQAMLVVGLQESISTMQTFMARGNYRFPVVADKDGITAAPYNITLFPYHVFIDVNGNIQDSFTGVLTREELMQKLSHIP